MKKLFLCVGLMSMTASIIAQTKPKTAKPAAKPATKTVPKVVIKTQLDSIAYAIGVNIASSLQQQSLGTINTTLLQKGLDDALKAKKTVIDPEQCNMIIQTYMQSIQQKTQAAAMEQTNIEKARSAAFLDSNRKRAGVITLPNGLQYEVLKSGGGDSSTMPKAADTAVVHYAGTTIDGIEFDNSNRRGEPLTTPVTGGIIVGWTEILKMMHVGDKWKVYIPSELGWGDRGAGGGAIPGGATTIFEMELLGIKPAAVK